METDKVWVNTTKINVPVISYMMFAGSVLNFAEV
jgi:hypothetical protein